MAANTQNYGHRQRTAALGARKKIVPPAQRHVPRCVLGKVVAGLEPPIGNDARERLAKRDDLVERLG